MNVGLLWEREVKESKERAGALRVAQSCCRVDSGLEDIKNLKWIS